MKYNENGNSITKKYFTICRLVNFDWVHFKTVYYLNLIHSKINLFQKSLKKNYFLFKDEKKKSSFYLKHAFIKENLNCHPKIFSMNYLSLLSL